MAAAMPVPSNEAPPDYSLHAKEGPLPAKAGLAVQIQIDGKLVPGTVMEDVSEVFPGQVDLPDHLLPVFMHALQSSHPQEQSKCLG